VQFSVLLAAFGSALFLTRGFRAPGVYGLRRPARLDWLSVVPVAVFGALAGGVWIPAVHLPVPENALPALPDLLALLTLPLAAEVIFRGLVQGSLVMPFAIQSCGGPWFVSGPTIVSAALYALWGAVLGSPTLALTSAPLPDATLSLPLVGSFVFGAAAAMARERSESIGASLLLHWICVAAVLLVRAWIAP
jgi:membrane protease YdiL (CAAX protease family)